MVLHAAVQAKTPARMENSFKNARAQAILEHLAAWQMMGCRGECPWMHMVRGCHEVHIGYMCMAGVHV